MTAKRVLIVDDVPVFREPVAKALRNCGYRTMCAGNGKDALTALEVELPDIILLDVAMPEMDGLTCLGLIRRNPDYQHIPVILLTAVAEKDYVLSARELNIQGYLVKSYFSLEVGRDHPSACFRGFSPAGIALRCPRRRCP